MKVGIVLQSTEKTMIELTKVVTVVMDQSECEAESVD